MSIQEDSHRMWQNELRSLRGVPQRESINQVVFFGKWCEESQVNISNPTIPGVANFIY